ncbi:MAG: class A beta-lactamase-related serine hydrolase [Cytophagales bacterium]|jgi:beta-lactamase class A|nr:class A beta-lactamase-related serine hydrolase [Cytophagales bacterium]
MRIHVKPIRQYLQLALIAFGCVTTLQAQSNQMTIEGLRQHIETRLTSVEGRFAVVFKQVDKPENRISINGKEVFHAASTMKTPVMIEVFDQAKAGKFKLTDSVLVKNEFKSIVDGSRYQMDISDDSGEGLYKKIGQKTTVYELIYEMITVSSNLATNILIEKVGAASVTNAMNELGASDIRVLRGVEDQKAFDKGWNNTVTADDLAVIYEKLARGQVVSREASGQMRQILEAQKFNEIIPAKLPKTVKLAHKTGEITGVRHDSGIVTLPDGQQYVLVLLSKGLKNPTEGVVALADVSEMIYQFVAK